MRAKAALNVKTRNATGGGPHKEYKFSDTEQAIYNLVGMKESVEGVAAVSFGLNSSEKKRKATNENEEPPEKLLNTVPVQEIDLLTEVELATLGIETHDEEIMQKKDSRPRGSASAHKSTASEVLEKELLIQKELCETVKVLVEGIKEQHRITTKIYRSLEDLYDIQKKNTSRNEGYKEDKE